LLAWGLASSLAVGLAPAPAAAERADRNKPMVLEADRSGSVDLQRQIFVYDGNAVITQGTMVMRAERIEIRQTPDGFYSGQAIGAPGKPASWRQLRDGGGDEVVEGTADRIDFDGRADTLRFIGNSAVRRLRDGVVADEIVGGVIVWDNLAEVFRVEGGAVSAVNPTGRVRAVLAPRPAAGAAAGAAASAPASAPAASGSSGLQPSRSLGPAPGPGAPR
jgi:lipopolysaccharide export system protein LptA